MSEKKKNPNGRTHLKYFHEANFKILLKERKQMGRHTIF
jgi:hypothetical protein